MADLGKLLAGLGTLASGVKTLKGAFGRTDPKPHKQTLARVRNLDERVGYIIKMIQKGRRDPKVRQAVSRILGRKCGDTWCVPEKNWRAEVNALFWAVRKSVRYTRDPVDRDLFQSPARTAELSIADCLPGETLLLRSDGALVPVAHVEVGQRIHDGRRGYVEVLRTWKKGVCEVHALQLNNGSWFQATGDHKVPVAVCDRHLNRVKSRPCSCPVEDRRVVDLRVDELQVGQVLLAPDRLPFGDETIDPDMAYLVGLYIADGWTDPSKHGWVFISGQDGCEKEAQKKEVVEIANKFGRRTSWQRKSVGVHWPELYQICAASGRRAPEKSIGAVGHLAEAPAAAMLRGLMADSGANTNGGGRTFTTTSRLLAVQTRVLLRMFGKSTSERFIPDHGGLGKNPIWRLGIRDPNRSDGNREKLLRVKAIERDVRECEVYDLMTSSGYIYLPEADVVVHNCDDYVILLGALLNEAGYPILLRVVHTKGEATWNHIYLVALLPGGERVPLDASVNKPPGWEVAKGKVIRKRDFKVP